jgi:hypothetical protein
MTRIDVVGARGGLCGHGQQGGGMAPECHIRGVRCVRGRGETERKVWERVVESRGPKQGLLSVKMTAGGETGKAAGRRHYNLHFNTSLSHKF